MESQRPTSPGRKTDIRWALMTTGASSMKCDVINMLQPCSSYVFIYVCMLCTGTPCFLTACCRSPAFDGLTAVCFAALPQTSPTLATATRPSCLSPVRPKSAPHSKAKLRVKTYTQGEEVQTEVKERNQIYSKDSPGWEQFHPITCVLWAPYASWHYRGFLLLWAQLQDPGSTRSPSSCPALRTSPSMSTRPPSWSALPQETPGLSCPGVASVMPLPALTDLITLLISCIDQPC